MKKLLPLTMGVFTLVAVLVSAPQDATKPEKPAKKEKGAKKVEMAHPFYWAAPDPLRGDWQGSGGYVAQVIRADDRLLSIADQLPSQEDPAKYQPNIFPQFHLPNPKPVAFFQAIMSP